MSCAEIESLIPTSAWRLDALEVSLATIFGAILGVILAVIISRCFVKELARSRVQKTQDDTMVKNATYEAKVAGYTEMTYRKTKATTISEKRNHKTLMQEDSEEESDDDERYDRRKDDGEDTEEEDEGYEEDREMMTHTGIIIALTKPSNEKTMVELSLQDFQSTKAMEKELQQEKEWVFMYLLRILLGKFVAAEKMDETFAEEFLETTNQEMKSAKDSLQGTQMAKEEELRKNSDLSKDPLLMEEALENSRLGYIRQMDGLVQENMFKVKDKLLSKDSGLTTEQVEAIMNNLMENLATAEKMISQEQNRQATILQERLAKQQALSEQYGMVTLREHKGNQTRTRSVKEIANYLSEERELNQAQAKSIIKQYEADMEKIQDKHKTAVLKHSQELSERLQQHRERKLRALDSKQAEEREKLGSKAPKVINPADFVEAHHDLLEQQRNEKNDLMDELDFHEAEELSLLRKKLEEERVGDLKEKESSLFEELVAKAQLNDKEAHKIVKKHEANVKAHNEQLDQEKKRQNALLQEKINKRKASWEEEQKRAAAEQQQLAEQQERTISKLIDTQSTLDEEAKKQIMLQHEQNMTALNSHLQMTKLKQQKLLEAKLSKRRARYDALKEQQEQERHARGEEEGDEDSKLQKKQREELEAEEASMREEQQAAILALRRQLALETEEMLKEQDARMGLLIGRLQVGQARRQGVIKKLDRAVKDLQDQLVDTLSDNNTITERKTERIIATHIQEMEEVEDKLRHARAHQEDQLQHKMETLRLTREKSLANDLKQNEPKVPIDGRRQSNVAKTDALQYMNRILEDNRQKQAMRQLEQEMKVEALKQKEDLNAQLEEALEEELKERERDFLGQLAALSQISKEELNNMVQTAIAEKGGDESDAKKLSKDLNKRLKSARARPELDPNAEDEEEEEMREEKPKKKKKKGKMR